jgi:hypothetical protein
MRSHPGAYTSMGGGYVTGYIYDLEFVWNGQDATATCNYFAEEGCSGSFTLICVSVLDDDNEPVLIEPSSAEFAAIDKHLQQDRYRWALDEIHEEGREQ